MAWGRLDDKLHSHPKTMRIPRECRCAAIGLWTLANSWCNSFENDGLVPAYMVAELGGSLELAEALCRAGMWASVPDVSLWDKDGRPALSPGPSVTSHEITSAEAFQVLNWDQYNFTAAQLYAKREAEAARKRQWRESKKGSSKPSPEDVPPGHAGQSGDVPQMSPLIPFPNPVVTSEEVTTEESGDTSRRTSSSRRKRPASRLPDDWTPNAKHQETARLKGLDLEKEATKFRLHAEETDRRAVIWNAAFSRWLENARPRSVNSGSSEGGRLWQD